jgi:hypothetical protein
MQLKQEIEEITKIEKKLKILTNALNCMSVSGGQFSLSEWQEMKSRLGEVIDHIKLLKYVGVSLKGCTDIFEVEKAVQTANTIICQRLGIDPDAIDETPLA